MYEGLRLAEQADNEMTYVEISNQMRGFLEGETHKIYLIVENDIIYGYGLLNITRTPKYFRHLFIRKKYRKHGYGKKLFHLILAHCGISMVDIDVLAWNQNAIDFYNHLGFDVRMYGMRLNITK